MASGQALGVDLAMGGLAVGGFVAEVDVDSLGAITDNYWKKMKMHSMVTWYVKYTAGPVSFGYQKVILIEVHELLVQLQLQLVLNMYQLVVTLKLKVCQLRLT